VAFFSKAALTMSWVFFPESVVISSEWVNLDVAL